MCRKSGSAAEEFKGDAPRGWAVEGKFQSARKEDTRSITRPKRQIHNEVDKGSWRFSCWKSTVKLGKSVPPPRRLWPWRIHDLCWKDAANVDRLADDCIKIARCEAAKSNGLQSYFWALSGCRRGNTEICEDQNEAVRTILPLKGCQPRKKSGGAQGSAPACSQASEHRLQRPQGRHRLYGSQPVILRCLSQGGKPRRYSGFIRSCARTSVGPQLSCRMAESDANRGGVHLAV